MSTECPDEHCKGGYLPNGALCGECLREGRVGHLLGRVEVAGACTLHGSHNPAPLTSEGHHIIPVAWQLAWQPPKPWPHEGRDPEGRGLLWDARTAVLCPTGHRNVHYMIVRAMRALGDREDIRVAESKLPRHTSPTAEMALDALRRFQAPGGKLSALVSAGNLGYSVVRRA